jgi:thioredoxin reductase
MIKALYNWSKDLVICTNGKQTLSDEQKTHLKSKGIAVEEQPIAALVGQNGQLEYVRLADGTEIPRTGGFATPTLVQSVAFSDELGCEKLEIGGIKTDEWGRTSVPGLYSAGDASYVMPSQLIYAAADGSRAAVGVNMDLTEEQFA